MIQWTLLSLLLVLACINGQINPRLQFEVLHLGDGNILMKWQPTVEHKGEVLYNITVNELTASGEKPATRRVVKGEVDRYSTKLSGLKPDTKYKISMEATGKYIEKPLSTSTVTQTRKEFKGRPAKPDFDYEINTDRKAYPGVKIVWLPCGKQDNCKDASPGAHFYVKYEQKGVDTFITKHVQDDDFVYLTRCSPGKAFIVRVVSVNQNGETESDAKEVVLPTIPNLEILEVMNSDDVIVPCRAAKSSKGPFKWTVNTLRSDSPRLLRAPNGDLTIQRAERFDRGQYICSAVNGPKAEEYVVYLDVKDRTVILNAETYKTFERKVGRSFRKDCNPLHDNSLSVSVNWLKDGKKIKFEPNGRIKTGEYNTLQIPQIAKEDAGNYTCVATTRLDSAEYHFKLNVV